MKKFETIKDSTVYKGKVFDVRNDEVRLPNGQTTVLDIVAHPPAVVIVPLDNEGNIWFVRQYRHAAGQIMLELPAGVIDPGEQPYQCALRELREEIGMSANQIQKIGDFYIAPGYSSEFLHIYVASELQPDALPRDEDEFISVERISTDLAYSMIEEGEIQDAKTLASLLLAYSHLR